MIITDQLTIINVDQPSLRSVSHSLSKIVERETAGRTVIIGLTPLIFHLRDRSCLSVVALAAPTSYFKGKIGAVKATIDS